MRIDVCRGRDVAVTEPFPELLHADVVGVQETGTAVTEIMKADPAQPVLFQKDGKVRCKIGRHQPLPDWIDVDVIQIYWFTYTRK